VVEVRIADPGRLSGGAVIYQTSTITKVDDIGFSAHAAPSQGK